METTAGAEPGGGVIPDGVDPARRFLIGGDDVSGAVGTRVGTGAALIDPTSDR